MTSENDITQSIELTADDIRNGIKREKTVILKSSNPDLDGKTVRVRPLRAREYKDLTARNKIELQNIDLGSAYALQYAACKITKPPTILTPGILGLLDDLEADVVGQIGDAILGMSEPKEGEVSDFSTAQRARQS